MAVVVQSNALVGVEHEFSILRGDLVIDAGRIADRLIRHGARLRPDRGSTLRLACGGEVSWEEGDAEVATPPLPLAPGVIDELVAWSGTAEAALVSALPSGCELEGRSTHISVSVPDPWALDVAALFVRRFGPTLMMLTEASAGDGLLVRPRNGRVELGCEYARGDVLRAAAALAAGGALACLAVARGEADGRSLPSPVDVPVEGATRRFGWYLDLRSLPPDLVPHHRVAWDAARRELAARVAAADLRAADDAIDGRAALPRGRGVDRAPEPPPERLRSHPLGIVTADLVGPGVTARAISSTWDETVFEVTDYWRREPRLASFGRAVPPSPPVAAGSHRTKMPRGFAIAGLGLAALGMGLVLGGLVPGRSAERVAAAPAPTTAAVAVAERSSVSTIASSAAQGCAVTASISFAQTQAIDGGWILYFPVEVRDRESAVLAGATVSITNQKSDGTSTSATGVTAEDGVIVFGVRTTAPGQNGIQIVEVDAPGCAWDRDASVVAATGAAA